MDQQKFNLKQSVDSTHKNLAGLLGKLVESLTLHLEDLYIEGKKVLPEIDWMSLCKL